MLHQSHAEPVFQIGSEVLDPVVPSPHAGQDEMLQSRSSPKLPSLGHMAGSESFGEPIQIGFDGSRHQGQGVVLLEDVLAECVFQDPDGLANGMAPLLAIGLRPEKVGQLVPGNRGGGASHVDQNGQRFSGMPVI